MFSKQVTDKLSELFDNLFKTDTVEKRADKLTIPGGARLTVFNPAPGGGQAEEVVQEEILNLAKQQVP
jgi:hypothetical protein